MPKKEIEYKSVQVDAKLHKMLKVRAAQEGLDIRDLVTKILARYLNAEILHQSMVDIMREKIIEAFSQDQLPPNELARLRDFIKGRSGIDAAK